MDQPDRSGILLVSKPRGMTSFGVVSRLRRLTGVRKIGHTGTLDPFAEGLLAICIGSATRVVQFMDHYDKTYQVRIVFGSATDTLDCDGQVTARHDFAPGELAALRDQDFKPIRHAVSTLVGRSLQEPPMYSAVKIDGRPLYELARQGQQIERKSRPIEIYSAVWDGILCRTETEPGGPYLALNLTLAVSKGTYIRVIADQLGRSTGLLAHADRLVRTVAGPFHLTDAVALEDLMNRFDQLETVIPGADSMIPGADSRTVGRDHRFVAQSRLWQELTESGRILDFRIALTAFPVLRLEPSEVRRLVHGQDLILDRQRLMAAKPDLPVLAFPVGQTETPHAVGSGDPDEPDGDQRGCRLSLDSDIGLIGIGHLSHILQPLPEQTVHRTGLTPLPSEHFRLVTERIFINHECLLSS